MSDENVVIRTNFVPLRMISGQKDPVNLQVAITNKTKMLRGYSVSVKAPSKFGFDKSGLMSEKRVRIGFIPPMGTKTAVFSIFGKFSVPSGLYDMDVVVREHEQRYDKVTAMQSAVATLRVE
jgi:hypothetical protein